MTLTFGLSRAHRLNCLATEDEFANITDSTQVKSGSTGPTLFPAIGNIQPP
jgi:hypothetical protein